MSGRGAYRKKQQNIENVLARHAWFVANLNDLTRLAEAHMPSLSNQRSFAALSLPGTPIQAMSLNTLKSIANEVLARYAADGKGFLYLDALRQALKKKTIEPAPVRSVAAQRRRREHSFEDMRKAVRLTEVLNLQRSQAYVDLFSKVVALSKTVSLDDATRARLHNLLHDHRDLYAALLSPTFAETAQTSLRVVPGGKA
jgi:hypothetical protein